MDLNALKDRLTNELTSTPQRQAKALQGLESLRNGLAELAQVGYSIEVVESGREHSPVLVDEFPKMLYREHDFPTELAVQDEVEERDALGRGYFSRVPADVRAEPEGSLETQAALPVGPGPQASPIAITPAKPLPVVNSQPVNPVGVNQAPKPVVTDKQALDEMHNRGVGASTPSEPVGEAQSKVALDSKKDVTT